MGSGITNMRSMREIGDQRSENVGWDRDHRARNRDHKGKNKTHLTPNMLVCENEGFDHRKSCIDELLNSYGVIL